MKIVKLIQKLNIQPNLYHFRSHSGAEVDLIIELDNKLFPIEIKSKTNPNRRDIRGIAAFKDCFPNENIQQGLVICAAPTFQKLSNDALAVPWWYALFFKNVRKIYVFLMLHIYRQSLCNLA